MGTGRDQWSTCGWRLGRRAGGRGRPPWPPSSGTSARDPAPVWAFSSTTCSRPARRTACPRPWPIPTSLVTGTPYVDVWEAVKPAAVGIANWPQVARGTDWKTAVCRQLGVPGPDEMWRRVRAGVRSYTDLHLPLGGAVARLIDFVTEEPAE